jgi:hypothetical protein
MSKTIQIQLNVTVSDDQLTEHAISPEQLKSNIESELENHIGNGMITASCPSLELNSWEIVEPSSTLVFQTSERHFKASAKRLKNNLHLGHSESQQVLSQALFAKPFEEIKETILKDQTLPEPGIIGSVNIIDNGGEILLFINGKFNTATFRGTDNEQSIDTIYKMAQWYARDFNCSIDECHFDIDDELNISDVEYEDMELILGMEGIIKTPLLAHLERFVSSSTFTIRYGNGEFIANQGPSENWADLVQSNDYKDDTIIWNPIFEKEKRELSFSLKDFLTATILTSNTWCVNGFHITLED